MRKAAFVGILVLTSLGSCSAWAGYWLRPVWEIWSQESGRSVPDEFRVVLFPKAAALEYADRECQSARGKREEPVIVAWGERDEKVVNCEDENGVERFVKRSDFAFVVSDSSEESMVDAFVRKRRESGGLLRNYDATIYCSQARGEVVVRFAEVWPNYANRYEYTASSARVVPLKWERGGKNLSSLRNGDWCWWWGASLSVLSFAGWLCFCASAMRCRSPSGTTN